MGTGASVPKETSSARKPPAVSAPPPSTVPSLTTSSHSSAAKDDFKATSSVGGSMIMGMDNFLVDDAGEKPISNNKLKKMALGIQGYKDKDRDYDQTLAQMDFNKTQNVEWSEPKSPEKVLTKKASKDNVALEMKHDASSPSLRPYGNSRTMEFSPMSTLQPKSSAQNVLSPGMGNPPRPHGTPAPGPPPGVAVRPFPGGFSGKAPEGSADLTQSSPLKGPIPSQSSMHQSSMAMTTPIKGGAPGMLASPPSQHYIVTPMAGPGTIPVRPFNAGSPAVNANMMATSVKGPSTPMMMAIPPNAARGSAPVQVPIGGSAPGGPPMMMNTPNGPPQIILGPNGIPVGAIAVPMSAIPVGAIPINAVPMGMPPGGNASLVPASPAGVIASAGPGLGPRGPPSSTTPLPIVKETKDVKRNKAQLPSNLTHAKPTTGDWLNKRYIVNNYILLDVLGTGSYGEVRLCKDRTSERLYAIKIISKDFLKKRKNGKTTETYFEDIKREIAIMKKLLHPNILRLYEVLDDPKVNKMYLVLEYMKKGDLINVLKKRDGNGNDSDFQTLSDFEVWQIFRQLVTGIRYLHFQNIVHGDIKPQNLLLGEDGLVKIADFGISQMLSGSDEQLHDAGGTPAFMAPELCEGKKNFSGQLADIWAIGATIFMLRFGQPPFVAKSIINLYYKICNDPLVFPATPSIEPGLQNLIEGMLEKNPEKRLTIAQIVAHPWYRQPPPPPSLASLAPAVNAMASPMVANKGRPSVPAPAPAPSTTGSSSNSATTASSTPSRPLSSNGGTSVTVPTSAAAVPTFQPPPSYDDEANEAMKGPIHRTILNNDDVFMSIGNISVTEHEDYEGAIGDVIEEGEDEDSDEEEDNDEDEGGRGKKAKGVKAADKLLGRNRDVLLAANKDDGSRSEHKDGSSANDSRRPSRSSANPSPPPAVAEDKRDKLGRKIKPVAAKAAAKDSDSDSDDGVGDGDDLVSELASSKSPSKKKTPAATAAVTGGGNGESPSLMETGGGDIMGTNWGADVFQMVEDDEDDRGDDDDEDVDVDSDEGNDRFDATRVQATGDTKGKTMVRKESHSEMSEEEEARRSRRFMKKITKKSTENMMRSLPSDGASDSTRTGAAASSAPSSSAAAGSRSAAAASSSKAKATAASAASSSSASSGAQNHSSMAKSQSQPLTLSTPHIGLSSHSTTGSAAQLFPAGPPSQSTGLNSLNTSSTSSSPLLKPGSRSARGDPTRTFSMNSTFDDDEPEALTTEEFQAMMDTLSQQNTQGSRYAGNGVEPIGEEGEGEESSSRVPGGANGGGGGGGSGGSGPSSAQSTLVAAGHRSNSVTDQGLIDVAMQVVWDQIESLKVSYLNPRVKIGGAFHSEQGIRPTQEDRCVLLPNVAAMQALAACDLNPGTKEQLNMFALAGIFDGHDGWRASQYLAQYLATMLVTHDKFVDPKQLNHAINDTFTSIDLQLCDLLREEEDNSGSTGVVAVYDGRKKTLTVAGVGDSLCILCRNGHAVEMNKMHRITDNVSERERVKNAGGTIINNRVNGVLAVSRSFGDTPFKTLHELQSNVAAPSASHPPSTGANHGIASAPSTYLRPPVKTSNLKAKIPLHRLVNESLVTAVPEIYTEIITPKTEFALLASDGLWDTMTPQLAVSFVRERLARDQDLQHAAQAVVQEALRRGSIDNVTVLILSFNVNIHA